MYATFGVAALAMLAYSVLLARRPAVNKEVIGLLIYWKGRWLVVQKHLNYSGIDRFSCGQM